MYEHWNEPNSDTQNELFSHPNGAKANKYNVSGTTIKTNSNNSLQLLDFLYLDESREDLFSLLAFLDSWSFQIASPEHTLCDVGQWLQEELGCEMVEGNPQYLLSNPAGPSAALVFHWQKKNPFLGELVIYCRCSLLMEKSGRVRV